MGVFTQRTVGEGAFDEDEKIALGGLSQRLTETATLSTAVGRVVLSNVTNALGFIKRAAIALDRFGSVLDVNPLAKTILAGADIRMVDQRLVMRDRRAQSSFNDFLDRMRIATDLDALAVAPIVIRREGRLPIVIRIFPVDGAARSPFLGARAILILSGAGENEAEQLAMLRQAFRLTPSEARIAVCRRPANRWKKPTGNGDRAGNRAIASEVDLPQDRHAPAGRTGRPGCPAAMIRRVGFDYRHFPPQSVQDDSRRKHDG